MHSIVLQIFDTVYFLYLYSTTNFMPFYVAVLCQVANRPKFRVCPSNHIVYLVVTGLLASLQYY